MKQVFSIMFSFALAVFFFSAAIAFPILCRPFYYWQARSLKLPEQTGLDEAVIYQAYDEVMDYLVGNSDFGTGTLKWSESGKSHFEDCKRLFRLDFVLLLASSAIIALLLFLKHKMRMTFFCFMGLSPAFWSALGLLVLFLCAAVWAAADFDGFFTSFHSVCFPGKTNWIFDYSTDEIILILPEEFWARTGALVLGIAVGGSVSAAVICEVVRRKRK